MTQAMAFYKAAFSVAGADMSLEQLREVERLLGLAINEKLAQKKGGKTAKKAAAPAVSPQRSPRGAPNNRNLHTAPSLVDVAPMHSHNVSESTPAASTIAGGPPILTVALEDSFLMNEVYYKQLVKQRSEAFSRLETCVNTVSHEIRICKERNGQLTRKVRELDSIIDQERRKWRERVEEEKAMLAKRTGMSQH